MRSAENLPWTDRSELLCDHPGVAFIYQVLDAGGTIIYIGLTRAELGIRFGSHKSSADWWKLAVRVQVREVPDEKADGEERAAIHHWHPEHNKVCWVCKGLHGVANIRPFRVPLYQAWRQMLAGHADQVCCQWHIPQVFAEDMRLFGPEPEAGWQLQLIDPEGMYAPGNVHWQFPAHHRAGTTWRAPGAGAGADWPGQPGPPSRADWGR